MERRRQSKVRELFWIIGAKEAVCRRCPKHIKVSHSRFLNTYLINHANHKHERFLDDDKPLPLILRQYFEKLDNREARCLIGSCNRILSRKWGNTLTRHLWSSHCIKISLRHEQRTSNSTGHVMEPPAQSHQDVTPNLSHLFIMLSSEQTIRERRALDRQNTSSLRDYDMDRSAEHQSQESSNAPILLLTLSEQIREALDTINE